MPSINGYSGYYPPSYLERVHRLQAFPAAPATVLLRRAGVHYVIVHLSSYRQAEAGSVQMALAVDPAYVQLGSFSDGQGTAVVYRLR
jgi:hypothetical protein